MCNLHGVFNDLAKKGKSFRFREYKKTESKDFVQSSLKSHPLCVTLYMVTILNSKTYLKKAGAKLQSTYKTFSYRTFPY